MNKLLARLLALITITALKIDGVALNAARPLAENSSAHDIRIKIQ
jgi:hypothetical protein